MEKPRHIETQIKDAKENITRNAGRSVETAFRLGFEYGEYCQRQFLRSELEKYKGDSVVAELLLEKFQEE